MSSCAKHRKKEKGTCTAPEKKANVGGGKTLRKEKERAKLGQSPRKKKGLCLLLNAPKKKGKKGKKAGLSYGQKERKDGGWGKKRAASLKLGKGPLKSNAEGKGITESKRSERKGGEEKKGVFRLKKRKKRIRKGGGKGRPA